MEQTDSAIQIQQQMQAIRRELRPEVDEIVDSARTLMTWQHYVSSYPWASLGVAAAVGYLVVPSKLHISSPDLKTLKQLAKDNRLVVESNPKSQVKPGLVASLVTLAGTALLRAGVAYAGQQAGRFLEPGWRTRQQTGSENDRLRNTNGPAAQRNRF